MNPKSIKFRAYAHTRHDVRISKAVDLSSEKFSATEPKYKEGEEWDKWYEDKEQYRNDLYLTLPEEIIEEDKMVPVSISLDSKLVTNFNSHVKKFLSEPMQFIGLKDKREVKIFEGDLVIREYKLGRGCVYKIKLVNGKFDGKNVDSNCSVYNKNLSPWYHTEELVVIGNIYENPELISE